MMKRVKAIGAAILGLGLAASSQAAFVVSVENAGVQNSTSTFSNSGVGGFNGLSTTGSQGSSATTSFSGSYGSSGINGSYTGAGVYAADQFGGAGGTGNYLVARDNNNTPASYSIAFSQSLNYFGLWISALDAGNQLSFYNGSTLVYSYSAADLISAINGFGDGSSYYGNPNGGGDAGQPFAFVNFYAQGLTFNSVTVSESLNNSGFESDNHTVGTVTAMSGRIVAGSVPEASTWVMLILGFGAIGWTMRRGSREAAPQIR